MKEELTLLHYPDNNPNNWWVFNSADCPDPFGFPSFLYRKYQIDSSQSDKTFNILLKVKEKLVELFIMPSPQNQEIIFPTNDELNNWDKRIKRKVLRRLELLKINNQSG